MQSTVTLELYEYNDLYLKALYHENLEIENKQLKEELAIAHKQLEELQQPKDDTPTYTVKLDGSKVYKAVKKAADEFMKELEKEELLLKQKEDLEVWMKKIREKESNGNIDEKLRLAGLRISSLLKEKYHPHMSVLITSNGVTMLEDYLFVPNN